jgi:hypothetical protein
MCLRVSYKKKYEEKKSYLRVLKVTEERSRIRSWIWFWIRYSQVRIRTKLSRIPNIAKKF